MVRWDVERSPISVQLLVRPSADHDLSAQVCLESTRLAAVSLRDTGATVSARQELTVIVSNARAHMSLPAAPASASPGRPDYWLAR